MAVSVVVVGASAALRLFLLLDWRVRPFPKVTIFVFPLQVIRIQYYHDFGHCFLVELVVECAELLLSTHTQ